MRRLASVAMGRIVFTSQAMPAVRPVNHLIDDGRIILRTSGDSAIITVAASEAGTVVAYEADDIDPATGTGWSVIVTGLARPVTDPAQAAYYHDRLDSWDPGDKPQIIAIDPGLVTGIDITTQP